MTMLQTMMTTFTRHNSQHITDYNKDRDSVERRCHLIGVETGQSNLQHKHQPRVCPSITVQRNNISAREKQRMQENKIFTTITTSLDI